MIPLLTTLVFIGASAQALPDAKAPGAVISVMKAPTEITLQVKAPAGTHLNYSGPWKLEVTGTLPLKQTEGVFDLKAFDKTKESFRLPLIHPLTSADQGLYTMTYFYCATDNSWCRRAQVKGQL